LSLRTLSLSLRLRLRLRLTVPRVERPDPDSLRDAVREHYAAAAREVSAAARTSGTDPACCAAACCTTSTKDSTDDRFGAALYSAQERAEVPDAAQLASLGCGNPTAVAELREGETVLDLGSGGGIDVLLSARRVGPTGRAYGLDMTEEMLALALENQRRAGVVNVQWLRGHIEDIPLPAESVDVVISNCVINLSADKPRVLRETARVLRPGGRLAVTDVVADDDLDQAARTDMEAITGCIAGALTRREFEQVLKDAGLVEAEITETHRVHRHGGSAIIRARKPGPALGEN
jgi:arsenite methyltransferase